MQPQPFRGLRATNWAERLSEIGWRRPLLALCSLLISAELVALGYYRLSEERIFYLEGRPLTALEAPAESTLVHGRLHPYFGFVAMRPELPEDRSATEDGAAWRPNNHGFLSRVGDYPIARGESGRRFVAVFGGSVALQCALHLADDPGFEKALRSRPGWEDREIVVLNFAQPGYKQPQQLLILSYFLALGQEFDLVLNIDGFNELALAQKNVEDYGIAPSLPTGSHLSQLIWVTQQARLDGDALEALLTLRRLQERRQKVAAWHDASPSAAFAFLLADAHARLDRREQDMKAGLEQTAQQALEGSMLSLAPADPALGQESAARRSAQIWAESSRRMHDLLQAEGIDYLHLLQPNQYYSQHRFSDSEAAIALRDDQPYRAPVSRGYPELVSLIPQLRDAGIEVIDAVGAFDQEARRVYADDCCHYNQRGLAIIAGRLSDAIRFPVLREVSPTTPDASASKRP